MKVLYVKNNSERAKEFQLQTIIYEENGQKFVKKQALCSEAIPHLKKMKESYEKLTASIIDPKIKLARILNEDNNSLVFEYIKGESLEKKFNDALKQGEKASNKVIDEYMRLLKRGFRTTSFDCRTMITNKYKKIFGNLDYSELEGKLCFEGISNIDLIFSNIIFKDNSIYLIDYEWAYELNVVIDYILFRAIHNHNNLYEKMENEFIYNLVITNNSFYISKHNYLQNKLDIAKQLQERDHQIQDKDHQIQDKDHQIQDKDHQIQDKDHQIQDKDHQIQDKDHQIQAKDHQIQAKDHQLIEYDLLKYDYSKMYTSMSWRITRFLRKLKGLIR